MKDSTKFKLMILAPLVGVCISVGIAIVFWGSIGYVAVHFIRKLW